MSKKIPYTKNDEFLTLKVKEKIFPDTSRHNFFFYIVQKNVLFQMPQKTAGSRWKYESYGKNTDIFAKKTVFTGQILKI